MNAPVPITGAGQVDLGAHAVIEASAGTGKTYTIEHLVARLVTGDKVDPVPLERILVVTFTEKAAGELKDKLRSRFAALAGACAAEGTPAADGKKRRLEAALERYDEAQVFTIHGFCRQVLAQYAFENGESFSPELADDDELRARLLAERIRKDWPAGFGARLPEALAIADYPDASGGASDWERIARSAAARCRTEEGEILLPPATQDAGADGRAEELLRAALPGLLAITGPLEAACVEDSPVCREYEALTDWVEAKSHPGRLEQLVKPLLRALAEMADAGALLPIWLRLVDDLQRDKKLPDNSFRLLRKTLKKGEGQGLTPLMDRLQAALDPLLASIQAPLLRGQLLADTARALRADLAREKQARGQLGYDDMVARVRTATADPAGPLVERLRSRYACALVDEFQDTDSLQWDIFRNIFVAGDGQARVKLFMIADPKQAIYGFRGADVRAYLRARRDLLERGAGYYELGVTWRSLPGMVAAWNKVFAAGWFAGEIQYRNSDWPGDGDRQARLYRDELGRAPLTIVDIDRHGDVKPAETLKRAYAGFIADECRALLGLDRGGIARLEAACKDRDGVTRRRPVHAGDLAVLTRTGKEAILVENALRSRAVPCTIYKKPGLFQADEALHLSAVLGMLAAPGDRVMLRRALLSRYLAVPAGEIERADGLAPGHPLAGLLERWRALAAKRAWPELFRSLLADGGLAWRERAAADGERRLANHRHLAQILEAEAANAGLDIVELAARLDNYRRRALSVDEDADLMRLETEAPRVQIMTIHASKGLEFAAVFVFGGFTQGTRRDWLKYHDDDGTVVYDLLKDEAHAALAKEEELDEFRRLYYVALTRAKYRLYVPKAGSIQHRSGPTGKLLHTALEAAWPAGVGDDTARHVDLDRQPCDIVTADLPADQAGATKEADAAGAAPPEARPVFAADLFPEPPRDCWKRTLRVESFTHLAAQEKGSGAEHPLPATGFGDDDTGVKTDDDPAAEGREHPVDGYAALPRGQHTGTLVHELLEELEWSAVGAAEPGAWPDAAQRLAREKTERHLRGSAERREAALAAVCRLVHRTLTTPLPGPGRAGHFRLADVDKRDRLAEVEFWYPADLAVPGTVRRPGYVMGFLDLVFRRDGRFFLLDWKTNHLDDGYGAGAVESAMERSAYGLQSRLYVVALRRWLRRHHPGTPFDGLFGGVYYLFLRGLDPERPGDGVFFRTPRDLEVDGYEAEIAGRVWPGGEGRP